MQIMVKRIFPQIAKGFNDTFSLPLFDVMSLKVKRRPDSSNGLNVAQKLQLTTNHSNSIAWARFWFWFGLGFGFGFGFWFRFRFQFQLQFFLGWISCSRRRERERNQNFARGLGQINSIAKLCQT